jgi:hypothetical protein
MFAVSCSSGNPIEDAQIPAVIVTRADGLRGTVNVFVDGKKLGKLPSGGKWGIKVTTGVNHSVIVEYKGQYSDVRQFRVQPNGKVNFMATCFESDKPSLTQF